MIFRSWSRSWSKFGWAMPIFHKLRSSRNPTSTNVLKRYHSIWENIYFNRNICLPGANNNKNFDIKGTFFADIFQKLSFGVRLNVFSLKIPKTTLHNTTKRLKKGSVSDLRYLSKRSDPFRFFKIWSRSISRSSNMI